MGIAYHPHYLVWFEHGRTEYLRSLGSTYRDLEESGTLLVVVETGVRHLKSARYDDELEVRTRLESAGGVRLRFTYEVARGDEILATGFTLLASADLRGRPRRLPAAFVATIAPSLSGTVPGREAASAASNDPPVPEVP